MQFIEIHDQTPDSLCDRRSRLIYDYPYQLEQYLLNAFDDWNDRTVTVRLYDADVVPKGTEPHTARLLGEWRWDGYPVRVQITPSLANYLSVGWR